MIIDTILSDIKTAMKNKDAAALTALRGIHAQIKDATVNAGKDLTDDAVLACLEKAVKQRADAIALYEKGGRPELAAKEQAEMDLFKRYLPAPLSREEIEALARETMASTGITSVLPEPVARMARFFFFPSFIDFSSSISALYWQSRSPFFSRRGRAPYSDTLLISDNIFFGECISESST